ncbi:MAG TPA: DUF2332 family protein [Devosia sp.]|nr:DUF2332 family protein [Devosia sp.]
MPTAVTDAFLSQAEASEELGSPFTAGLCRLLAARLDHTSRFGHRILDWPGDPFTDALALRACGALHALSRSGLAPDLTAVYPPGPFDVEQLGPRLDAVLTRHDEFLTAFLDSAPQTNEVARSGIVLGAALHVAAMTGLPIELLELGASAGLNLRFDRYHYDLGNGLTWGAPESPVRIRCDWRGALPPTLVRIHVVARAACDRKPLDPGDRDDANRLLAYIWPDQAHRLARTEAALQIAAADGLMVAEADAADWLERHLALPRRPGTVRMLFHTIAWQYFPPSVKARAEAALTAAGEAATTDNPFAHFSFEADGTKGSGALNLRLWPGARTIPLGRADFHGRWVEWVAI